MTEGIKSLIEELETLNKIMTGGVWERELAQDGEWTGPIEVIQKYDGFVARKIGISEGHGETARAAISNAMEQEK